VREESAVEEDMTSSSFRQVITIAACAFASTLGCSSSTDPAPLSADTGTASDTGTTEDTGTAADTGSTDDTGVATDTGTASDTGSAAETGDPCAPIANVGTTITKMTVATPPPTMTGGTIVDGTYALTAITKYNGVAGSVTHKATLLLAGGKGQEVDSADGAADKHTYFTYTTSGSELTMTAACGGTGNLTLKYTATPTTFMFLDPTDPNESRTYTKK
jgi:hypothetical protein